MKRRRDQERDEAEAREQADVRREALLADLKAREAAGRAVETPEQAEEREPPIPGVAEKPQPDDAAPAEGE